MSLKVWTEFFGSCPEGQGGSFKVAISSFRVGQRLVDKEYGPQLCVPTFFEQGSAYCYIRGCHVEIEVSPASGLTRIRRSVRYCLIATNARSHSSFHSARLAPLRVVKKGFKWSVNREIKLPRAANRPVSCWIPFLELGAGDCKMVLSCAGLASISLWVTIKPRNRPTLTPKAHFKGFSFIPYSLRRSNVCWRCTI